MKFHCSRMIEVFKWHLVLMITLALPANSFEPTFDPISSTRTASLIVTATVKEVGADSLVVHAIQSLKGQAPQGDLRVSWAGQDGLELVREGYSKGDRILVFLTTATDAFRPVNGKAGIVRLRGNREDSLIFDVRSIVAFDKTNVPNERKTILAQLLVSKTTSTIVAGLHLLYREKSGSLGDLTSLIKILIPLASNPDRQVSGNAAQCLGKHGDKDVIPVLIGLVRSADIQTAREVAQVLEARTGVQMATKLKQGREDQNQAALEWQEWWTSHKDKTNLRRLN